MHLTNPLDVRIQRRGIPRRLVDLALEAGEIDGDRYVLSARQIQIEIDRLNAKKKLYQEASKRGGIVVVLENDAVITTYRKNSFSRTKNRMEKTNHV